MPPKKPVPVPPQEEYEYDDNLSVRLKEKKEKDATTLDHYFGELLRDDRAIDRTHKYCSLCLQSHKLHR